MYKRTVLSITIMILGALGIIVMLAVPVVSYKDDLGLPPYETHRSFSVHFINGDIDADFGGLEGTLRWNDYYGSRTGNWPTLLVFIMLAGCVCVLLGGFLSFTSSRNQRLIGSSLGIFSSFLGIIAAIIFNEWWVETVFPILEEDIGVARGEWNYQGEGYIIGFFILMLISALLFFVNCRSVDLQETIKYSPRPRSKLTPTKIPSHEFQRNFRKFPAYCQTCGTTMERSSLYCDSCGAKIISKDLNDVPQVIPHFEERESTEPSLPAKMLICHYCGHQNLSDAITCGKCKKKLFNE